MIRNSMAKARKMVLAGIMVATIGIVGCGEKTPSVETPSIEETKTSVEATVTEEVKETAATPTVEWKECTEEEARALVPSFLALPDGFELVSWSTLEDGSLVGGLANVPVVQMEITKDLMVFDARAQVTGDEYLNLYAAEKPEWSQENDERLTTWGDEKSYAKSYYADLDDNKSVNLLTWYDEENGVSYSFQWIKDGLGFFPLNVYAELCRADFDTITAPAVAQVETGTTNTETGSNAGSQTAQAAPSGSDLFYAKDISALISALVQELGLYAVSPDSDRDEENMFVGGDYIAKYGYKGDGAGGFQTYLTFYDLGDCMATNVTVMGWDGVTYYDYGEYTFDTVKQSLINKAQ